MTYDALGRKLSEAGPFGTTASEYDLAGRRTRLSWPGGFSVDYDHLVTGEVSAIRENGATSGPGVRAVFAYDNLGRRTGLTRGNGSTTAYAYDALSRLQSLSHDLAGTAHDVTIALTYNPASQIATRTLSNDLYAWTGHGSGSTSSTVNGLNQLTLSGGASYAYDPKGNMISDGTRSYAFSSENLLGTLGSGPAAATVRYDPAMRLLDVTENGNATRFLFDGGDLIAEYANGTLITRTIPGPGTDEPMGSTNASGARSWHYADERGSIIATEGSTTRINSYDEYGKPGPNPTGRFGYTGLPRLTQQLYYSRARVYDWNSGRFVQPDPIGYGAGMNLYGYVGGDPVNFTDPTGLQKSPPEERKVCTGTRIKSNCGSGGGISNGASPSPFLAFGGSVGGLSGAVYAPGSGGSVTSSGNTITVTAGTPGQWINPGSWGSANFHSAGGGWWDSHDFTVGPFFICPDSQQCRSAILDVFPSYIVPNLGEAVVNGQVSPIYRFPEHWFLVGHVQTFIYDKGLSATNVTLGDHMLRHGRVDISNRLVGGSWYVGARGHGNNLPFMGTLNQFFGPGIFSGMLGSYVMVVRSRLGK